MKLIATCKFSKCLWVSLLICSSVYWMPALFTTVSISDCCLTQSKHSQYSIKYNIRIFKVYDNMLHDNCIINNFNLDEAKQQISKYIHFCGWHQPLLQDSYLITSFNMPCLRSVLRKYSKRVWVFLGRNSEHCEHANNTSIKDTASHTVDRILWIEALVWDECRQIWV